MWQLLKNGIFDSPATNNVFSKEGLYDFNTSKFAAYFLIVEARPVLVVDQKKAADQEIACIIEVHAIGAPPGFPKSINQLNSTLGASVGNPPNGASWKGASATFAFGTAPSLPYEKAAKDVISWDKTVFKNPGGVIAIGKMGLSGWWHAKPVAGIIQLAQVDTQINWWLYGWA